MDKLKPCPFCGWKAILHTHHSKIYIGCANDKCFTFMHLFETDEEAIESWNKRARVDLENIADHLIEAASEAFEHQDRELLIKSLEECFNNGK